MRICDHCGKKAQDADLRIGVVEAKEGYDPDDDRWSANDSSDVHLCEPCEEELQALIQSFLHGQCFKPDVKEN